MAQLQELMGQFVPSTQVWDVSEIHKTDVTSPEFKELIIRLYQNLNNHAIALNDKDSGVYDVQEYICGQSYFPTSVGGASSDAITPLPRAVYRKVFDFGALLNAIPKNLAHDITLTPELMFTRIYGATCDPINHIYLPLPYSSATLISNIELQVNDINIIVTPGSDRTAFTKTYIILEYLKI